MLVTVVASGEQNWGLEYGSGGSLCTSKSVLWPCITCEQKVKFKRPLKSKTKGLKILKALPKDAGQVDKRVGGGVIN